MNDPIFPHYEFYIVGAALAVLAIYRWCGCLHRSSLESGRRRVVGLYGFDVLIVLGLMLVGMTASSMVSVRLGVVGAGGGDAEQVDSDKYALAMLLFQLLSFVPALIYLGARLMRQPRGLVEFGLVPTRPLRDVALAAVNLIGALVVVMATLLVSRLVAGALGIESPELGHDALEQMAGAESKKALGVMVASAVVVAPLCEEVIYRGLLQTFLNPLFDWSHRWVVVAIAAGIFTAIHIGGMPAVSLPGIFVLGVMLGWLYERYGSLWLCILLHAGFNAINTAMVLLAYKQTG